MSSLARAEYELQLHRVLMRTMRAVVRRGRRDDMERTLTPIQQELDSLDERIAALPADAEARPMLALAARLGLDGDEVDFLWTAVALAADPLLRVHAADLDDVASQGLTTSLYCRVAELSAERSRRLGLALISGHPAVHHGLLRVGRSDGIPSALPIVAAAELVCHLASEPRVDPSFVRLERLPSPIHDPAQTDALTGIAEAIASRAPLALFVEGPELTGRRTAVALAASQPVLAVDLLQHPPGADALAEVLIALRRECLLRGAIPLIAGLDEVTTSEARDGRVRVLAQFLDSARGPVVLVTSRPGIDLGSRLPSVRVTWPVPDVATRMRLWSALAGAEAAEHADLATRFALGAGAIQRAVASSRLMGAPLMTGVRQNIAERLGAVAERVTVKQTWDDLVLADDTLTQVRALTGRVRHAHTVYEQWGYRSKMPRGVGVAALFSGPPGTGKTMVAGLIAQDLDLDLYQIDLSKVVSKWVGETEKQLAKVFDAAEAGHALLLFDEADALFGQRSTEMRGATDRYANLEVNFLLQRIESFGGVVIMTTNLDASLDKALKRRLAAHVVFPHPDDDERALLWRRLLTADHAPLDANIDIDELARVFPKMTGANIRNAALSAAFLAASEQRPTITHDVVMHAARGEYLAMGQVLSSPARRR